MSIISESGAAMPINAVLTAGISTLSANESVKFSTYNKFTSPLDGSVWWINSGASQSVSGSVHYAIDQVQEADQTVAINRVIFTTSEPVELFTSIDPQTIAIGDWSSPGGSVKIAFSHTASVYDQAGLFHYSGDAVYPAFLTQVVESASDIPADAIIGNSLPIWLEAGATVKGIPVYPSYLVPANARPPYVAIHIDQSDTTALAGAPVYGWPGIVDASGMHSLPSTQLMKDECTVMMVGLTNQAAIQWLNAVFDYSLSTDSLGFMNSPAINDAKVAQNEITTLAMRKIAKCVVSYYQSAAIAVARRLITSAAISSIVR